MEVSMPVPFVTNTHQEIGAVFSYAHFNQATLNISSHKTIRQQTGAILYILFITTKWCHD